MLTGTAAAAAAAAEAATPATTLALAAAVFTVAAVTAASKEVALTTCSRRGKGMEQCQAMHRIITLHSSRNCILSELWDTIP